MARNIGQFLFVFLIITLLQLPASAQDREPLIVGVKGDYPPFGFLNDQNALDGYDVDVARFIAKALNRDLILQAVSSANRLQKLGQGEIDLVIATMGDTAKRRELVRIMEPNYFASGVNLLIPQTVSVSKWSDLTGQSVCALRGSLYNKVMAQRHLLDLKIFASARDGKLALRNGDCVGWLYDDISILNDLKQAQWQNYHMPLPSRLSTPWAVAGDRSEEGMALAKRVEDILAQMHRDGVFLRFEGKWGLGQSRFLQTQTALWQGVGADGQYLCRRDGDGNWPVACRNQDLLTTDEASGLLGLSLWVRDMTGLNVTLLHDPYDRSLYFKGILYMAGLVVFSVIGSVAFGLLFAWVVLKAPKPFGMLVHAILTISQMTPPLLQLYLIFFGLGAMVALHLGVTLNAFAVACFVFSLYAGAANARALLYSARHIADHPEDRGDLNVGWRLYLRLAYGPIMASSVNITKATGMASLIAVPEIIYASNTIQADNGNANVMLNLTVIVYFVAIFCVVWAFERMKKWEASQ